MKSKVMAKPMKRLKPESDEDAAPEVSEQVTSPGQGDPVSAVLKLQHRKEQLERLLRERCSELKKLCMQEFELTGVVPMETPFDTNESPPKAKKKIVTMFPYDSEILEQLTRQGPTEESLKRKALSPWNSCEELPYKASSPYKSPTKKHNTWTSPPTKGPSSTRAHLRTTLKFFKKRLQ